MNKLSLESTKFSKSRNFLTAKDLKGGSTKALDTIQPSTKTQKFPKIKLVKRVCFILYYQLA